jgi:uncharacterized protein (UPF0332 family)
MLLTGDHEPRTHRGTREVFRARYCQAGALPVGLALKLDHLETARAGADYGVGKDFTDAETDLLLGEAEAVLGGVEAALRTGGWLA